MLTRWWTLLVWAAVALSAGYWGLLLASSSRPVPAQAHLAEPGGGLRGDLSRLLGSDPLPVAAEAAPQPMADARFTLIGVVSPRSPQAAREGVALIAVDGKPARAYRVGAVIEGSHVLKSVSLRGAKLGLRDGPGEVALNIPPPAPAATGSLPSALSGGVGSPPLPQPRTFQPTQPGVQAQGFLPQVRRQPNLLPQPAPEPEADVAQEPQSLPTL